MKEYAWHVHHQLLWEQLKEPIQNRIDYIKKGKPKSEIATRLRLLKPIKNVKVINTYNEATRSAWKTYDEARASALETYGEARASASKTFDEARASASKTFDEATRSALKTYNEATAPALKTYDEARASAKKTINELHAKECPNCPWNGKTIFP